MGIPKGSRLQVFPQRSGPGHAGDVTAAMLIEDDATIADAVIMRQTAAASVAIADDGVLIETPS